MADERTDERAPDWVVATFTDEETGEEGTVTTEQVLDAFRRSKGAIDELMGECYTVTGGYGGGLVAIDLHPDKLETLENGAVTLAGSGDFDNAALRPGRYFGLYDAKVSEAFEGERLSDFEDGQDAALSLGNAGGVENDGLLMMTDPAQVVGEGVTLMPVTLSPNPDKEWESTDPPYEPIEAWIAKSDETGAFVSVSNMIGGVMIAVSLQMAIENRSSWGAIMRASHDKEALLSISTASIEEIDFATDKMNRETWNQWAKLEPGQLAMGFAEDGSGELDIHLESSKDKRRGLERVMTYDIRFDELESLGIAPRLDPYDRRVYEALSSLWHHVTEVTGQETFSIKDIHYAMGFTSNPGDNARTKINDSITKMSRAHIAVDNLGEVDAGYHYPHFKYDASLLPMERLAGYVDGQLTEGLIHLFREPPLFTFARERKQFTTFGIQLLQTPLNKTNKNLMIEDYLREQIAWMKNGGKSANRSNKITFADMFKEAGIKRRDDKARQKKNAAKVLNHYVKCGWIDGFKEKKDGFEIFYQEGGVG